MLLLRWGFLKRVMCPQLELTDSLQRAGIFGPGADLWGRRKAADIECLGHISVVGVCQAFFVLLFLLLKEL